MQKKNQLPRYLNEAITIWRNEYPQFVAPYEAAKTDKIAEERYFELLRIKRLEYNCLN